MGDFCSCAGSIARDVWRLLENGLGAALRQRCHDDKIRRAHAGTYNTKKTLIPELESYIVDQ